MIQTKILDTAAMSSPELDALAANLIDEIRFARGKAMAHFADPRAFPLPADGNALERILVDAAREAGDADRLDHLRAEGARFVADPLAAIGGRRADVFEAVDLRSNVSILDQLAARRRRSRQGAAALHVMSGDVAAAAADVAAVAKPRSTLTWHLRSVDCVEETGWTNHGSDQLYIGGTTIDPFGNVVSRGVHDLTGGWDTTNALPFDLNLAVSNLSLGVGWPRTYYYVSAISVRGTDKLYALLDKIVQYARDYAVDYVGAAAGAAAGLWVGAEAGAVVGSLGGPLGAAAGAVVGAIVGYLVGAAIGMLWAEISGFFKGSTKLFGTITIQVDLPMQGVMGPDGSSSVPFPPLTWSGHGGTYQLQLDAKLGWIPTFEPAAISRLPDHLELVCTKESDGLMIRSWSTNTSWAWSNWELISGYAFSPDSPIAVVAPNPARLDVIAIDWRGRARARRRQWQLAASSSWTGDELPDLPSGLIPGSVIGAASCGPDRVDVFATGKDGKVYTAASGPQTSGGWAGWWPVGQGTFLPGTPVAAVSRSQGRFDLFAIGLDGRVWSAAYGPDASGKWDWVGWFPILDEIFVPGARIGAVSRRTDQIDLFAVNLNGEVKTASWSPDANDGKWGGWWRVTQTNGTFTPGTPISVVHRSEQHLDLFAIGLDGCVWSAAWGEQTSYEWAGWWCIGKARFAQGSKIAATSRGLNRIDLFVRGFDGNVWSQAWDGTAWNELVV